MKPSIKTKAIVLSLLFLLFANSQTFSQVTRGAYLQMNHQNGITIRWQTSTASNSRVRIGTTYDATGNYPTIVNDAASVTEHIVTITGLTADTKYFYSIGTSTTIQQVSDNNFFRTAPPANTTRKIRVTVFGDCGAETNNTNQTRVHNGYQKFLTDNSIAEVDALLQLGDLAYNWGTHTEFTNNFFTPFGGGTKNILRNHPIYPAPGNHEYNYSQATASRIVRTWPYFSIFSVPSAGQLGGTASNKANYYSYDIGDIHFLSLDSHGMEENGADPSFPNSQMGTLVTTGNTAMRTWIEADLAANTKKWVVAYWHHPPYSKGSHNSDNGASDQQMIDIRQRFIRFLELEGVDLVLGGHSHAYERSKLIRNHLGLWNTYSPATHEVFTPSRSGKYDGTTEGRPFIYNSMPKDHGTVYVVSGNAGANNSSTTGFGTNVMPYATTTPGFFYFEVEENRLDAQSITTTDGVNLTYFDKFTIMKDVNTTKVYNIVLGQSQILNASWPAGTGTFVWTGAGTSGTNRSTTVTPATAGTFVYTVADNNNGGLLDNFTVNVSGTLPVTFTNFSVQKKNAGVLINWKVAAISNHDYFSVERSSDGIYFTEINRNTENINNLNEKSFTINDINLPTGKVLYYRIKQCDFNGVCKYSDIKSVRFEDKTRPVLYPMPAEKVLNISYTGTSSSKLFLTIAGEKGNLFLRESKNISEGRNQIQIDISFLKAGTYIIVLNDGREKWTEKLIKL